jgi:RimK-like ATP-grasp domain
MTLVLLWGIPKDTPLAAVRNKLQEFDIPVVFVNQYDVLCDKVKLNAISSNTGGILQGHEFSVDLSAISGAYIRPYNLRHLADIKSSNNNNIIWQNAICLEDALTCWTEFTSVVVINRLSSMASNNSKPYQLMRIQALGLNIPDTIVTTDQKEVLRFWQHHGTIIYKSTSGIRSIVTRLTLEHLARLNDIRWCPTQFQEYVPGTDYRVHVVGDDAFSCEIISGADDYRYAVQEGKNVTMVNFDLPMDIRNKCIAISKSMGLVVAGIDLRLTPDGKWYCFEVNPSPAFTYYQKASGQPIDDAIAHLLAKGRGSKKGKK